MWDVILWVSCLLLGYSIGCWVRGHQSWKDIEKLHQQKSGWDTNPTSWATVARGMHHCDCVAHLEQCRSKK